MDGVRIETVDPTDEAALRSWWEVTRAAADERPYDLSPAWETARRYYPLRDPAREVTLLGARIGDGPLVGAAWVARPVGENEHLLMLDLQVHPAARRRGVGGALVAASEEIARADARTTIIVEVLAPPATQAPGESFARSQGYAEASSEDIKICDLATTADRLPGLAAHAAERLSPYTLLWWSDPTPEEHLEGLCALYSRFHSEIPLGDLDLRAQAWTPQRLRGAEERRVAAGRAHLLVAGVAPDGRLVGYSDLNVADASPHRASIESTLVLPEHRGHRLGLAMKALLHQQTRALFPAVEFIVTGNAGVNTWMNAVNEQLGYGIVERCLDMQKVL
ncbi:MAG: GNAT family N-acetyltransferase [Actinobacteria bacterium]|uniref:Unannotated protein n=1 Tax=freshwater metagenome TaxID=449393 RepID=A0A6J6NFE8_9ZZZZ|nr:GNAT family N-acetyltransferase [Actinomycetota bacterium]